MARKWRFEVEGMGMGNLDQCIGWIAKTMGLVGLP